MGSAGGGADVAWGSHHGLSLVIESYVCSCLFLDIQSADVGPLNMLQIWQPWPARRSGGPDA